MNDQHRNTSKSKRQRLQVKVDRCLLWLFAVLPLLIFAAKCRADRIDGPADLVRTVPWLGLGLAITVSIVLMSIFTLERQVDDFKKVIDGFKSSVNVETIRSALNIAIFELDDPTPYRIDVAKRVLNHVMADLPEPPAAKLDSEEQLVDLQQGDSDPRD